MIYFSLQTKAILLVNVRLYERAVARANNQYVS